MQADVGVARRSDASAACVAASDKCQREKRKTIMGDDLLWRNPAQVWVAFDRFCPWRGHVLRTRLIAHS